jgi:class 3 adenylate cyclase
MRGRSKASSAKSRRRKPAAPKRASGAKAAPPRSSSAAGQDSIERLNRELVEARQQQTATTDVLRIISSSGSLERVFETILENATRICEAKFGILYRCEEDALRTVAMHDAPQSFIEARRSNPIIRPNPYTTLGRAMTTKQPVQIANILEELDPLDDRAAQLPKLADARTVLAVPMLKENELIGAFLIYRTEVRPFTEKQIAPLLNFAAQAAIAIENARLLNELRQRTADLSESLEQQTATSEVLRVISSSPGDLKPVFDTIVRRFALLCGSVFGSIFTFDGELVHFAGGYGFSPEQLEGMRRKYPVRIDDRSVLPSRAILAKAPLHIQDIRADADYDSTHAALGSWRRMLAMPMLHDGVALGAIVAAWAEAGATPRQHEDLLKIFANQAVIAIENARLLNELKQRTTDLSESLEQQTATSEVLSVISSSPGELEPVFQAMLQNALRICEAMSGGLYGFDGKAFYLRADLGTPSAFTEFTRQPRIWGKDTVLGQITRTKQATHIGDALADRTSANQDPGRMMAVNAAGARTILGVPLLRENELIGAFVIFRQVVRPFTEKQIDLVTNFAAQAVIAIENARLLGELRQRTDEVVKLNQQLEQRVADQVGEIERMGRLRRFLPPQVADLIVASGTEKQLESHRREITALFCDLRGFTGFSESSDPEDVMALLAEYHAAIGTIINKYSGTLERYAGDGVMVIFNDPVPVENPALQAVLMALDMRAAIGGLIEKWRDLGHDLGFGIGIAHGFATLGTIGFEGRRDYAAIGTVSNVASRLCDEAKPGQILISPRVRQAVEKAVTVESVGEFALKGIRRPMLAYNVLVASSSKPN